MPFGHAVEDEAERDQLRADLDAARKEVERMKDMAIMFDHATDCGVYLPYGDPNNACGCGWEEDDLRLLKADNTRLREALRKYGRHVGCAKSHRGKYRKPEDIPASDKLCTCGLDAALAGHGGG